MVRDNEDIVHKELSPKKKGRPLLLLGASLDDAVQQCILKLRKRVN